MFFEKNKINASYKHIFDSLSYLIFQQFGLSPPGLMALQLLAFLPNINKILGQSTK